MQNAEYQARMESLSSRLLMVIDAKTASQEAREKEVLVAITLTGKVEVHTAGKVELFDTFQEAYLHSKRIAKQRVACRIQFV